jgi:hypothetical protein
MTAGYRSLCYRPRSVFVIVHQEKLLTSCPSQFLEDWPAVGFSAKL